MAGRKLKVFQAQFGFYDTVIAAASQAAALRAWGTRQNLFASGEAKLADDEAAVAVALKYPETPLRRAVGSKDAFQIEPTSLPKVPHAPKPPTPKTAATKRGAKAVASPAPKRAPDRRHLDAAEAALRGLDDARKGEETDLRRRQDELDNAKAAAQAAYVAGRKAAMAAILEARKAFRAAGGEG
jgi:hypothetical protein